MKRCDWLLLACLVLARVLYHWTQRIQENAFIAGVLRTVFHSLVDIPFRCPAVLMAWLAALACLPALVPRPAASA
jgi:hypothetical protein